MAWWLAGGIDEEDVVVVYQPYGADTLSDSYINLANPGTNDAYPGVAPTLASLGWQFNGTTQYLRTNIFPAEGWSMVVRFANLTNYNCYIAAEIGVDNNSGRFGLSPRGGPGGTVGLTTNTAQIYLL